MILNYRIKGRITGFNVWPCNHTGWNWIKRTRA